VCRNGGDTVKNTGLVSLRSPRTLRSGAGLDGKDLASAYVLRPLGWQSSCFEVGWS
jgi:hypothetical protein